MKLLYIACNPPSERTLMIENEINELTLRISAIPGDRIQAFFLPYCRIEELPYQIALHRPDILHIAAHGEEKSLYLANAKGDRIAVTPQMLGNFLPIDYPPQLIYLNACNSEPVARYLTAHAAIVIGSTTPISNLAARASAGLFYSRIGEGGSVAQAFDAARSLGQALQPDSGWAMLSRSQNETFTSRLCERFEIVARFSPLEPERKANGYYDFDVGVMGCPPATRQVVIFTDESSFNREARDENESQMAFEMAMVGRYSLSRGTMWFEENWESDGDFRLFAAAVTPEGRLVTTAVMLCDAIDRHYAMTNFRGGRVDPAQAQHHLGLLRGWNGIASESAGATSRRSPNAAAASGTRRKTASKTTQTKAKAKKKAAAK